MYYISLIGFYLLSYYILMLIFNYSTYHKYFKYTFPVLIGYGVLIAFLFLKFGFFASFITYVLVMGIQLFFRYRKEAKLKENLDGFYEDKNVVELSIEKTLKYYILSSIAYLLTFSISYIYIFNTYYI